MQLDSVCDYSSLNDLPSRVKSGQVQSELENSSRNMLKQKLPPFELNNDFMSSLWLSLGPILCRSTLLIIGLLVIRS